MTTTLKSEALRLPSRGTQGEEEEWDIAVAAVGEGDAEAWAELVNACLPGESVLAMLKRTSTRVVDIEGAVK